MLPSEKCYKFIAAEENCRLKAYLDTGGVPTIGMGSTRYEDGTLVKITDQITRPRANDLLKHTVDQFARQVSDYIESVVNQNQFEALVSFAYNVGIIAFAKSTLLRKVDKNPGDVTIRAEFMRWNKDNGKVLKGLVNRRQREADLYFS